MSFHYRNAANLLDSVLTKKQSLQSICFNAGNGNVHKKDYALAIQTLTYLDVIKRIMGSVTEIKSFDIQSSLISVMIYEILFGAGEIEGGGAVKRELLPLIPQLFASRDRMMEGKTQYSELLSIKIQESLNLPIYIRINEAKCSLKEGLEYIQGRFLSTAALDKIVPSLVRLPPSFKYISQDSFISEGKLVIQDKASCFPAQILFDVWKTGDFLDCCAAPGNKTSHLAAMILENNHKNQASNSFVYAFDKSEDRCNVLKRRMEQMGVASVVKVQRKDFLSVDISSAEYQNVTCILLDPSCSGSGIIRNVERLLADDKDSEKSREYETKRLESLQRFQIAALEKAMTFPSARFISYSTCSIHSMENEDVVAAVLKSSEGGWEVVPSEIMSSWARRGERRADVPEKATNAMIRCLPIDETNGFFVTLFRRTTKPIPENLFNRESLFADKEKAPVKDKQHNSQDSRVKHRQQKSISSATEPESSTISQQPPSSKSENQQTSRLEKKRLNSSGGLFSQSFHVKKRKKRL